MREYEFTNVNHYNSLLLVKHRKYIVQEGSFNLEALSQILEKTKAIKEPEIPFPQADSFERVVNLCELLKQKEFIKLIISNSVFKQTLKLHLDRGEMPSKERIVEIMKCSKLYNVGSDSTYFRRASTVIGWTNWIINQMEE